MRSRLKPILILAACGIFSASYSGCDRPPDEPKGEKVEPAPTADPERISGIEATEILADPDAEPRAQLDAIHEVAEQGEKEAFDDLFRILAAGEPVLAVAAGAALSRLDAPDTDKALIDAAERFSRQRELEYLRQILYIIHSTGGPRAEIYLKTLAEGHEVDAIRRSAADILRVD